jgi:hypothetical protein
MKSKRVQAVVLTTAVVAGYAGAAVYSALAQPALEIATDFGPGDGLTRLVLTADAGSFDAAALEALGALDGVVSAQSVYAGRALVAADDLVPQDFVGVPGVAHAEFSTSVPVLGTISDPYYPQYGWNLENTGTNHYNQPVPGVADADMDATDGWAVGTGVGRIVAVVDTGFDSDHPDLQGALWTNPEESCGSVDRDGNGFAGDCHGWNFYSNTPDVDNGSLGTHGASVSGVVGARADNGVGSAGVAPGITIMPLVVGGGDTMDVTLAARAIRYAVDHGADVINASWGGAFSGFPLQALKDAVAYAAEHDVLVVAAAGNDAADRDTDIRYPASLTDPNVVTVGSSTAGDTMSPSSAYGAASVDLFAPGYLVATTWNDGGMRLVGGTSIAAPHVAAAYALYRAQMPDAGYAELKQALLDDVDPLPAFTGKSVTGGRLTMSRLTGTPTDSVTYAFTSMTAPAGEVTPSIGMTGPAAAGAYEVVLGLGMEDDGEIWALADKDITLDGVTVSTDDAGDARFPLGSFAGFPAGGLSPSMELGDGRYVVTVQLYRDGEPVGRTSAAPLLVGSSVPAPGGTSPGGTPPGGTAPGGTAPGGTTPGGTAPGGTAPGGTTPGSGTAPGGSTPPDSSAPVGPGDGGAVPVGPGTPTDPGTAPGDDPGTPPAGGSIPTDPSAPVVPGTPTPGTGTSPGTPPIESGGGTPPATGGTPAPSAPGTTTPGAVSPGPDTKYYDQVGPFKITSLSPSRVSVTGGAQVTIRGLALPANPRVRIGATASAVVLSATSTQVVFRVPARTAGDHDVWVFAQDGTSYTLDAALTYFDPSAGSAPEDPADSGSGTTPAPGGGTTPAPGGGTTPAPGGGAAPETAPVVRTGPSGERLVRSAKFGALSTIWSVDCSSSCAGVAI